MIEVDQLTKRYGSVTAINAISFTASPGQVTGFLGPNGAGKTTTMRILTGFMPPTSGKAVVAGYDVFDNSMEVRKRVGYLPENVPLYRDMTALGYLMFIAEIRGIKNRQARAMEVLERVRLVDRAHSRIRTLSKGMRQRVGVAQALIHDPEVLILDEPTIGLDPFQVLELRDLVKELGRDHTVLFSTHILSEAEQVCDSVVIINHGEIIAHGSPAELRSELESGQPVIVRVDAPTDAALSVITALPDVAYAEATGDGIRAIPASPQVDPRPEIARAVSQQGWALIELRSVAVTLEDIFLQVAGADRAAQSEADEYVLEKESEGAHD
ncbi:MAG TPA: ABC transporter ATP-binding protein [Spirillospora sp.]|nr:ABC transporter ATP-binding protein [Spirillospora sp.]